MPKPHRKHRSKSSTSEKARNWTKNFWDKYWSIIIALIAGFIIGALIFPKFFR
jgi:uncharacterized membrane protein YraQ (UPF0718 family)